MSKTTPRLAIPYTDPDDRLVDYPTIDKSAADRIEAVYQIAAGNVSMQFNAAATATLAITFPPNRFAAAPSAIICTARSSRKLLVFASSGLSTAGVTLTATTIDGAAWTGSTAVDWCAMRIS